MESRGADKNTKILLNKKGVRWNIRLEQQWYFILSNETVANEILDSRNDLYRNIQSVYYFVQIYMKYTCRS